MRLHIIIMVLLLVPFAGCDIDPTSEFIGLKYIYGTYKADFNAGNNELIIIRPDSIYIHQFETYDGTLYVDSARWEFYYSGGDSLRPRIGFCDFINRYKMRYDCYSPKRGIIDTTPVTWGSIMFKRLEYITIERCEKMNQYYVKQQSK